jgi:hypothetical protein
MHKEISVGTYKVTIDGKPGNYTCQYLMNCKAPCGYDLGTAEIAETASFRTLRGAMKWAHRHLEPLKPAGEPPLFATREAESTHLLTRELPA